MGKRRRTPRHQLTTNTGKVGRGIRFQGDSRKRRRMLATETNYGRVTTTKHKKQCDVWAGSACDCGAKSLAPRVSRRTKAGAKRYLKMRKAVIKRDGGRCRYCGVKATVIEVDHVQPWSKGGRDSMENLVTACRSCNQEKFDADDWTPIPLDMMDAQEHLDTL